MTIKVTDEQELSEFIASTRSCVRIKGGGTRSIGSPADGEILDVSGISGITLYEPGALTLVAKAGTPLHEVKQVLAKEGQRLAFEPMDHRGFSGSTGTPTIGGVAAANISGPRRISVGACRDYMLGVRFVDGLGRVTVNGGRVMKNVTGYDLVKLMAGSFGTLGVLSEVSLKVMPKPETRAVLLIEGVDDSRAIEALSAALGSPYDVSGAAHIPVGLDGMPVTMVRLEGFEDSVSYRASRLKDLLGGYGEIAIETDLKRTKAGWKWVRDVEAFHGKKGNVWRISVKPSDGPRVGARLAALGASVLYDWGGGLVWVLAEEEIDIRSEISGIEGHARIERTEGSRFSTFQTEGPLLDGLASQLRSRFDPRNILNRGMMN